jgi:vitamin B12 transporter
MKLECKALATVVACAFPAIASAQTSTTRLDPVVISASRFEQNLSDTLPSVSVISREEIEQAQAATVVDLLMGQPGIEISRNGGPGGVSTVFMRGQASNSTAIFIDGVRVQTDQYGGVKTVDIAPDEIERIEILRGSIAAVHGEAATGGAIHIFTRTANANPGPRASLTYGSRNTADLSTGYKVKTDRLKLGISVQRFSTDGYSAMNPAQNQYVNPDRDGYRRQAGFFHAEGEIQPRLTLGVKANSIDSRVDYDSGNAPFPPFSPGDHPGDHHLNNTRTSDLTVFGRFSPIEGWSSRLDLTRSYFEYKDFRNGVSENLSKGNQTSSNFQNVIRLGANRQLNFGIDGRNADFESFGALYDRDSIGQYLGYSAAEGRLDYQINIRHDRIKAISTGTTRRNSADTWLLGAGYFVTDKTKLLVVRSTSFRAPNTGELFDPVYGNLQLKPEAHDSAEVGAQHESALGLLRLTRFEIRTRDAIEYDNDIERFGNISIAKNRGFDLSLKGQGGRLNYRIGLIFQDPRDLADNRRLFRRARESASLDVGTRHSGVDWGARLIYSGDRTDFGNRMLGSYTVINLFASRRLGENWIGRLKLENLLSEKYQLAHGYDAPPRGVFLSLQYLPANAGGLVP